MLDDVLFSFEELPILKKKKRFLHLERFLIKITSHWYLFILFNLGKISKTKFVMSRSLRK